MPVEDIEQADSQNFLQHLFHTDQMRNTYAFMLVIGLGLMIICMITGLIKAQYNKEQVGATKKVITNSLKSVIYFAVIPLICLLFIYIVADLMNIIVNGTSTIFSGDTTQASIGSQISQGIFNASLPDIAQNKKIYWTESYSALNDKCAGLNAGGDYNYVLSILISALIIWSLLLATISLVERIINLILLYISAPIMIATSSLDEGARFSIWKDKMLSKYLGIMGNILSMTIYLYLASWSEKEGNIVFENKPLELFVKCIILVGGAFMCSKGNVLIAGLISHNEASQEGLSQQQSNAMLHGGMALGGAVLMGAGKKASALAGANGGLGSGATSPNLSGASANGGLGSGATATKGLGIGSKIKGGLSAVRNKGLIGAGGFVLGKTMGGIGAGLNPSNFRRSNDEFLKYVGEENNKVEKTKVQTGRYKPEQKKFLLRYSPEIEKQLQKIAEKFSDEEGVSISTNQIIIKALKEFIKKYGD